MSAINSSAYNSSSASLPANVTQQGNVFNGASQLVQLNSSGGLPAIDGSLLTNLNPLVRGVIINTNTTTAQMAALASGLYIFTVTPTVGLPSGVTTLNDIYSYNGTTWSLYKTSTDAPSQIMVGTSNATATAWQKNSIYGWSPVVSSKFSLSNSLICDYNLSSVFNGSTLLTTSSDGLNVSRWQNTGNMDAHLQQISTITLPTYSSNAFGTGISAVSFTSGTGLGSTAILEDYPGSFTIMAFLKINSWSNTSTGTIFTITGLNTLTNAYSLINDPSNINGFIFSDQTNSIKFNLPVGTPFIFALRLQLDYAGSSTQNGNALITIMANNTIVADFKSRNYQFTGVGPAGYVGFNIAANGNSLATTSSNLSFLMREFRVYKIAKSDTDIETLQTEMWARAGLSPQTITTGGIANTAATLVMQLDASALTTLSPITNNAPLNYWRDANTTSIQYNPSGTGGNPRFFTAGLNNKPTVRFSSTLQNYFSTTGAFPFANPFTIFVVASFPTIAANNTIFGSNSMVLYFSDNVGTLKMYLGTDSTQNLQLQANTPYVLCITSGRGADLDESIQSTGLFFTDASRSGNGTSNANVFIGKHQTQSHFSDMNLSELRVYSGLMTFANIQSVMQTLSSKWGNIPLI